MEADVYSKLDEDGGKKVIYKMVRKRDDNSKDEGWAVIKDRNGKLLTKQEAMMKVWENYFKELLNQEGKNNDLESPSYVKRKVEVTDNTYTDTQTWIKQMKKGRAHVIRCVWRW